MSELTLVKQDVFGGNDVDIYRNSNNEVFMTIEQLSTVLEYSNRKSVEKIVERNGYLKDKEFSVTDELQATDNKYYKTRLLNENGIVAVVSMCHRPLEVKNRVLGILGRKNEVHKHFKSRDEDEYIHLIQTTFKLFNPEREVRISDYRCDLLFSEYKLIVECDEYGHRGYDEALEVKRELYLKSKGYDLIRFNPNSKDFYIGDTLGSILEHLMNTNDFKKQDNEEEELCS